MSENDESALVKLSVSVGKLEVIVAALDKKVDTLDSKMDAMTQREASRSGASGARKSIFESYIKPFIFPVTAGLTVAWFTKIGPPIIKALEAIAKIGGKTP